VCVVLWEESDCGPVGWLWLLANSGAALTCLVPALLSSFHADHSPSRVMVAENGPTLPPSAAALREAGLVVAGEERRARVPSQ